MDLDLQFRTDEQGRSVISLSGAFDLTTREAVLSAGTNALEGNDCGVVLDLAGVTFIDSSGLGALVQLANLGRDSERPVVLRDPSVRVMRVLELTALDTTLSIERSTDATAGGHA
jgi:anti-sigma B factor antagonist